MCMCSQTYNSDDHNEIAVRTISYGCNTFCFWFPYYPVLQHDIFYGFYIAFLRWHTHQGVLHVCVRVRYLAPSSYSILRTARLAPTAWPPSTPIRLANLFSLCAFSIPEINIIIYFTYPCLLTIYYS